MNINNLFLCVCVCVSIFTCVFFILILFLLSVCCCCLCELEAYDTKTNSLYAQAFLVMQLFLILNVSESDGSTCGFSHSVDVCGRAEVGALDDIADYFAVQVLEVLSGLGSRVCDLSAQRQQTGLQDLLLHLQKLS